eukprot:TRINITY_DN22626_c0_g1_i2.p1 TRINITY_DN22626_c0_g1~~TRINITY_DN22626_c0_g1_i2.p1  ORF type:complete len:313 (+),score=112.19 TRINITY_DN22626_c0_g1_i2:87-941(+)
MLSASRVALVFGVAWLLQCSAQSGETSPVLMWSNSQYFSSKSHINDLVNFRSLGRKVSELSGAANNAELVFVFIDQQLRSEELPSAPLTNLKTLVSSAKSSISVPHVSGAFDASSLVSALSLTSTASFTIIGTDAASVGVQGAATAVSMSDFRKSVADRTALASVTDGVTDVIVVVFTDADTASHDALIADVVALAGDKEYVAVFTAGSVTPLEHGSIKEKRTVFVKRNVPGDFSGNTYWPDAVITGVIVSFGLLCVVLIGTCCVLRLQSEFKFDAELKLRKQT